MASDPDAARALPSELPTDPWPLFVSWLEEAKALGNQPNPAAMTLACVEADGRPSARQVICRGFDADEGWVVFYTNLRSRKAQALLRNPRAALVFHWDALQRQVRIEGPVTAAPDEQSDAYFATRPRDAQISAWASDQSEPIESRAALFKQVEEVEARFASGQPVARPPHWGGFRVWVEQIELWVGLPGRNHDRGLWTRTLQQLEGEPPRFSSNAWSRTRLQP